MKPNKLELENIGPFREKTVIDFSKLGNMFLICGDTGAGKTTILDSICFALYGSLPGSHPKMAKNLRSDFASNGEIAKVIFDFSINGSRYKIERTPPCPYINRKGEDDEKPMEVVLYKFCGNDKKDDWTLLFNKTNEANAAIQDLTGLSINEFSKIVLLPQGDFANFLRLSSNDRRAALAKLFPIDDYRLITEFAKRKEDEFKSRQKLVEEQLASLQENFEPETADEKLRKFKENENSLKAEQDELKRKQFEYAAQIEKAAALEKKFADLENLKNESKNVLEKSGFISSLESKLENNRKALLAKVSFENFKDIENRLKDSEENLLKHQQLLERAKEETLKLEDLAASMEEKNKIKETLPIKIGELERALTIEKDIIPLRQECSEKETEKSRLSQNLKTLQDIIAKTQSEIENLESSILPQEELDSAYDKASAQLNEANEAKKNLEAYNKLQQEMKSAEEGYESSCARYEKAKKAFDLLKTEINELEAQLQVLDQNKKAFELAKTLQDGEPCPVCGSIHHPKLADFLNADFSIEERLSQKKENLPEIESQEREALQLFSGVKSRYEDAKTKLENAEKPVFEAESLVVKAIAQKNEATYNREKNKQNNNKLNDFRKKLEISRNEKEVLQKNLAECTRILSAKSATLDNLASQFNNLTKETILQNETAENAVKRLQSDLENIRNALESFETEKAQNEKLVTEYSSAKQIYENQTENLKKEFEEASLILKEQLQKYNFETIKDLENAFLKESECASFDEQISAWKAQKEQLAGQIEALSAEIKDVPRPDIAKLKAESDEISELSRQKAEELNNVLLKKQMIYENQKRWNNLNDEMLSIREMSKKYVDLSKDLSGDNSKKLSFESWILGVYLEEIAAHASRRLSRISDGRYALHLKPEQISGRQKQAGLDLEIFDANTGKKRPCDTLSGGETFFVSISLALALTDVVQSRSGGVQLDSLFIDEGFGSLDDATLEKALSVLDEIRENRMIGIISHVGELKNRILHRIEVTKCQNGSTLKVIGE